MQAAGTKIGSHVSLVLQVLVAEEKTTQDNGEPYLTVHGADMEHQSTGPIRMWRFGAGDIEAGQIYVLIN